MWSEVMSNYDYKNSKKRIESILNDSTGIENKEKVPTEEKLSLTFHL